MTCVNEQTGRHSIICAHAPPIEIYACYTCTVHVECILLYYLY